MQIQRKGKEKKLFMKGDHDATMMDIAAQGQPPGDPPDNPPVKIVSWVQKVLTGTSEGCLFRRRC